MNNELIPCRLVAAFLLTCGALHASPVISAPVIAAAPGSTVSVPISVTAAADLTSWQFDLEFDPAILQADSVSEGPFMPSFGTTLFVPGVIDNLSGRVSLVSEFYVDLPPFPSGAGVLAFVQFTAVRDGSSPLVLSNVRLNLSDEGFDVVNGRVAAIPEPAYGFALGLLLVTAIARGRFGRFRPTPKSR